MAPFLHTEITSTVVLLIYPTTEQRKVYARNDELDVQGAAENIFLLQLYWTPNCRPVLSLETRPELSDMK
jgi:hypothetical protein